MQDLGYDFSIMALVPFLHLQASEYEGQPLWRGSNALLLTAPFAKRCLLLQDVDLSPIAFHFFFALPCVGEMTSACKSMKCTSRSRAALCKLQIQRCTSSRFSSSPTISSALDLQNQCRCTDQQPVDLELHKLQRMAHSLDLELNRFYIQPTINSSCSSNHELHLCLSCSALVCTSWLQRIQLIHCPAIVLQLVCSPLKIYSK